jgi:hypothetical protein
MGPLFAVLQVLFQLADYVVKAVRAFQNTDEGRAEWLDVIEAYERVTGDTQGAAEARAEGQNIRQNVGPSGKRPSPEKINLGQ